MLVHRVTLVAFRLFRKKFGQLARMLWANSSPHPVAKKIPLTVMLATDRKWESQLFEKGTYY